jgi:hypothetical protein
MAVAVRGSRSQEGRERPNNEPIHCKPFYRTDHTTRPRLAQADSQVDPYRDEPLASFLLRVVALDVFDTVEAPRRRRGILALGFALLLLGECFLVGLGTL